MSFNASNGHNIREQDRVDGGTLRLGGLIFDYISKCDPIMGDKWIFGSSVNERVLAAIQAHLTNSDDSLQYPTGEDISSVYSCVLTAGLKSEFDRVWGDDDSKRHKGRFLMWLKDAIEPQINANIFTSDDKSCMQGDKSTFESISGPLRHNRRLFHTHKGRLCNKSANLSQR